jgi:formiminoglutamate deiminase
MSTTSQSKFFLRQALVGDAWRERVLVEVRDGFISRVQAEADPSAAGDAAFLDGVVIGGLGNVHSHGFQRGIAGLTERGGSGQDHFWSWREVMYRFLERLTPEDVRIVTALAYAEMLESGFTQVGEFHYLHNDPQGRPYAETATMANAIAAAAEDTGIGLTLLPVLYRHGGFNGKPPAAGQRRFVLTLDDYARLLEAATGTLAKLPNSVLGIAPHSLRAVTADELRALVDLRPQGPIHIHAAEQVLEVEDCIAATGKRPVQWLLDNMKIDARWCLVHATQMTRAETEALARSGAVAGLCPATEANLGDGIFEGTEYFAHDGRFGIGTDSNICVSAAQELRSLEYSQRLRDRGRNRLTRAGRSTGRLLFDRAAQGGAQALGVQIGSIASGQRADFVVLDDNDPALIGNDGNTLLDCWIFAANGNPIREVYVAGRAVVADGRHLEREMLVKQWRRCIKRLLND